MGLILLIIAAALAVVAAALVLWRLVSRAPRAVAVRPGPGTVSIALDIDGDPGAPAIARLVTDAASRVFAREPGAGLVIVTGRTGRELGRIRRRISVGAKLPSPVQLRLRRPGGGGPPTVSTPTGAVPHFVAPEPGPPARVIDAFELSSYVRAHVAEPTSLASVVRAILECADVSVRVGGDVMVVGDTAVYVIESAVGRPLSRDVFDHAFLRIQMTGLRHGLVAYVGLADPADIRRREMLAPNVRHVGRDGVQRLADAAAAGADPLAFAAAPVVLSER